MTDPTPAPVPTSPPAAQPPEPTPEPVDTTDWKAEAKKWEARSRANAESTKTLEKQRNASMTEAEKSIADAKAAGRAEVSAEYGTRLVRSDFTAQAAKFNAGFDASAILDDLNLSKYVSDDGEPDAKAIKAAVERLIPAPASGPPSFDGGARTNAAPAKDMNDILRRATGRA